MKRSFLFLLAVFSIGIGYSQNEIDQTLTFEEYLAMVKNYHPLVKQAGLIISEGEAKLLKARGAFDPKLEVDFERKKFKGSEYWDRLNTTFKIPTWYGIEFKGQLEDNSGQFLNPEFTVPDAGLYSAGVSVSLARGFLINERMLALRQAKILQDQAEADQQLAINEVITKSSMAYVNWLQAYQIRDLYESFLDNAELRFDGIKQSYELGDLAAVDTLEASIIIDSRKLQLEQARVNFVKASLELSNYLWIDDTPVEVQPGIVPENIRAEELSRSLGYDINDLPALQDHPKLRSLEYKYSSLELDRRLKRNNLLPVVDLEYNFFTEEIDRLTNFNTANYKSGVNISVPLFLRKERGELKLAGLKLQDTRYEIDASTLMIQNKIDAILNQVNSLDVQNGLATSIVSDYTRLLRAEERKFEIGESSIFLVNSRESKLIENQLKAIDIENKSFKKRVELYQALGRFN